MSDIELLMVVNGGIMIVGLIGLLISFYIQMKDWNNDKKQGIGK